jgi:hypothetical protein
MKPYTEWHVLPHGDLEQLADNLFTVVGKLKMPLGETMRRMTVVRLKNEGLLIYSAIALDAQRMQRLEALGTPRFLIVPSGIHRLDVRPWKNRYPLLRVVAPEGALQKVAEVVSVDCTDVDFDDPRVHLEVVNGTDRQELAMLVESVSGKTLVLNDLIFNLPEIKGLAGFGLRALGFGPGHPCMPKLVKKKLVRDEAAVRAQLRAWAQIPGLERLLVAHGAPIATARQTLLEVANAA